MSSRPALYKGLRTKVPYYPLSPLKEIREKQETLFGLTRIEEKPETPPPPSPEDTEVFSTPMSVFTLVDIDDTPVATDELILPPPVIPTDLEIVDQLSVRIAENDAILQSQYAAIEYNQTQLSYYANTINDYVAIFNYNQTAVDTQIKKLSELSQEISEKQAQLASLNAQITTMMTAQLLSALTVPIST